MNIVDDRVLVLALVGDSANLRVVLSRKTVVLRLVLLRLLLQYI